MSSVIRYAIKNDKENIFGLIEKAMGLSAAKKLRLRWDWQFNNNPYYQPGTDSRILVLEKDNMVAGMISTFPVPLKIKDKIVTALWVGDYMSHPDYKGKGGFLLRKVLKEPNVFLGTPNPVSYPIAKRLGPFDICQATTFIKVLNLKTILYKRFKNKIIGILGGAIWKLLLKTFCLFNCNAKNNNIMLNAVCAFDDEIDEFWKEVSKDYGVIVVRDKKYLNWRFVDYPGAKYNIYIARKSGRICGYIVFRFQERDGLKFGYIVDILAKKNDTEVLQVLIQETTRFFVSEKADLITCLFFSKDMAYRTALKRNGFVFNTFSTKLTGFCPVFPEFKKDMENPDLWFFTRADSDIDMP